ncbi:MAG: hypothetical protein WAW52_11990, partial [Methanothrix sp.]
LGDIGPIIISLEEITCCYLVKCKLVLATGYYYEIYNKTGTLPISVKGRLSGSISSSTAEDSDSASNE